MPCDIAHCHGAVEHALIIFVHAKDKAAIDHDAVVVQSTNRGGVVAVQVLYLVLRGQVGRVERLKADEEAAQTCRCCRFHQIGA